MPHVLGYLSKEISSSVEMPSGFVLLIIVKCRRERDELKEGLLHKKKSGLDCFENFQSM